ncbi:hypothetical protein ACXR2U_10975 [Jatrophihabitans sp. YIM 134969]
MTARRIAAVAAFCAVTAVPLVVCVLLAGDPLAGLGLGFVVSGVVLLALALTVQFARHRREHRRAAQFPGPAGRRHDAASVAEAMVALAPPDWRGLRLEVDDLSRRVTVVRADGTQADLGPLSPALDAAIDQLDASTRRSHTPLHRLVLAASRDGTAKVTVE